MLEKQINDKQDSVKVSEVMGDAQKVAVLTRLEKVYTVTSASQSAGLNPIITIRVAKLLGRTRRKKHSLRQICSWILDLCSI